MVQPKLQTLCCPRLALQNLLSAEILSEIFHASPYVQML